MHDDTPIPKGERNDEMTTAKSYQNISIPAELAERLRAVFGLKRAPATLREVAQSLPSSQEEPRAEDLYSHTPSRHAVRIGGETRHTHCIMDALLVPVLTGQPAQIRSQSPIGSLVTITASPDRVEADATGAVVSFGVARADRGAVQQTACPYINAFPSRAEYERWAEATPDAVTMALPLAHAFALARAMAGRASASALRRGECCRWVPYLASDPSRRNSRTRC